MVLTIVVVHRAVVTRKAQQTFARVTRSVVHALSSVVTRIEVFGTKLYFRLTVITCARKIVCSLRLLCLPIPNRRGEQ